MSRFWIVVSTFFVSWRIFSALDLMLTSSRNLVLGFRCGNPEMAAQKQIDLVMVAINVHPTPGLLLSCSQRGTTISGTFI
jgi:hypothetical protein